MVNGGNNLKKELNLNFNYLGLDNASGDEYALANNIATESAFNIRVIHSFTLEKDVITRYSDSLDKPYKR